MKKRPLEIRIGEPKVPRQIGLRGAIVLVLAGIAGGVAVGYGLPRNSDRGVARTVAAKCLNESGDGNGDLKRPGNSNLVSSQDFDQNPSEYVDVSQCRELVLRWDGTVIGDQEVLDRAKVVVERERNKATRTLIAELCISNPKDQKALVEWVRDNPNCGQSPKFDYLRRVGDRYEMGLKCEVEDGGTYYSSADLERNPGCRPEKTETEKSHEVNEAKRLEDVRTLGLKGASAFMDVVNPDQLGERARSAGVEKELEEFVGWARRMKEMDIGKMQKGELMRFACAWKIFSEQKFKETIRNEKVNEELENNPELDESMRVSMGAMGDLTDAILFSEGVDNDNLDQCVEYLGNPGPQ